MPSFRRALGWSVLGVLALALAVTVVLALPYASVTAGGARWRAQLVDTETGRPLEGVVVHLAWDRCSPSLGGWAGCVDHDWEEVVTGADGRFAIRFRWTYEIPMVVRVSGPEIKIFKPGYGQWRHQGPNTEDLSKEMLLGLPPLKTRQERLRFYETPGLTPSVPLEQQRRFREAYEVERSYLFPR